MANSPDSIDLAFPCKRNENAHKGDFGKVLIVAGSPGMTGAAFLAGKAALRSGSGLVTIAVPDPLNNILESKTTCVMTLPVTESYKSCFSARSLPQVQDFAAKCDSVVLGPGIGRIPETRDFVLALVKDLPKPTIIDADALYHLSSDLSALKDAASSRILTPHPGEFLKLTGNKPSEEKSEREKAAADFAKEYGIVCVLKGSGTVVSDGKENYVNTTGNPGMATGGSGDVLAGIMASLIGQGLEPYESARSAVYLHGLAGDFASREHGEHSMIASDILDALPEAVKKCFRKD